MRRLFFFAVISFACSQVQAQDSSWHYRKDDPTTKKHIVRIDAQSFQQGKEGTATFMLRDVTARLYDRSGTSFKQINSKHAIVDERLGTLTYGPDLNTVIRFKNQ
jgi:hypothetical protein